MKNNTRRILLALLLVIAVLVSMATVTVFAEETTQPEDDGSTTIYFENNWLWTDVCCYYWDADGVSGAEWPGYSMTKLEGSLNGHEVYSYDLPAGVAGLIINGIKDDGSGNRDQTPDITEGIVDGAAWRMQWVDGNVAESFTFNSDDLGSDVVTPPVSGDAEGVYTVAGVAGLCGSEWNVSDTANDMTLNEETGLYELTITGVPAGSYECKVAANHSWDMSWGTPDNGEFGNYVVEIFEEQDVTITFDPATGTVSHTVAPSTGKDPDRPSAPTVDFDNCGKITIYVGDSANWGNVLVHAWVEGSTDIPFTTWPGLEMEWDDEKMLYFIELPDVCDSVVFNDGNGTQSADLVIPNNGAVYDNTTTMWSDIKDYTPPIPPENTSDDVTVYVKDDAGWGDVYIYYWDVDGAEFHPFPGVPMDLGDDGYYYATIPAGQYKVLFSNGGSWEDGSLLQTPDLIIPIDGKVYLSNGNSCLYDDADGNNNDAWHALGGGNQGDGDNNGGNQGENPNVPSDDNNDAPKKEMTFLQKMAKALLLFLRSIEDFFKGLFKKN